MNGCIGNNMTTASHPNRTCNYMINHHSIIMIIPTRHNRRNDFNNDHNK